MKSERKIGKLFKNFIILIIFAVFAVLIYFVTKKQAETEKAVVLPAVVIQKPVRRTLKESITISGYVEAKAMIPVVPFVNGTIMEYSAKAGNYVKKDAVLAKIDDAPYRQTVLQAEAAYLASQNTFERIQNLFNAGATTQQNYDSAKAQRDASKAQYDLANLQLSYTEVKAPVSGTILIADQAVGSIGNQTQPVAVIADLSNQVVRLKVPEKYFDLFTLERKNLRVTVTRPAEKNMYEDAVTTAAIENIAPYISPQSKNFEVTCHLNSPGERFRPGMYVKVQIAYKTHENALVLPIETKKMDGSMYWYDEEDEAVHYIEPKETVDDGEWFIIPDDLEDTWFVIDGQNFVFDGQKVKLYENALKDAGL